MLSASKIKLINSLRLKKFREIHGLYLIEGIKLVTDYIESGKKIDCLIAMKEFVDKLSDDCTGSIREIIIVDEKDLRKVSNLTTPNNALATISVPSFSLSPKELKNKLSIMLENIQDPGNLGTVIRTAAWFGIETVITSHGSVDIYNPKVIQSTMGSMLHVRLINTDLKSLLKKTRALDIPVYAACLDGDSVYKTEIQSEGIILLGNESKGLSSDLEEFITSKLLIPSFSKPGPGIESLNLGMSTAILCSEFRRREE